MKFLRKNKFSDSEILELIRGNDTQVDRCFSYLYEENYSMIASLIQSNSGTSEDVPDIFQEAMLSFYEKARSSEFELTAKISTYLYAISRNLWLNKLKAQKKLVKLENHNESVDISEFNTVSIDEEREKIVKEVFSELKEDCRELLSLTIYQNYSMTEAAEMMGYKNDQIARNKKHRCLGYLKKIIANNESLNAKLLSIYEL